MVMKILMQYTKKGTENKYEEKTATLRVKLFMFQNDTLNNKPRL